MNTSGNLKNNIMSKIKSRKKRKKIYTGSSQLIGKLYGKGIHSIPFPTGGLRIDIGKLNSAQIKEMKRLFTTPQLGVKFKNP